jgi:hypothetical protein
MPSRDMAQQGDLHTKDMQLAHGVDRNLGQSILWNSENKLMVERGDGYQRITGIDLMQ